MSPSILAEGADGNTPPQAPEAHEFLSIRRSRRWMMLVLLGGLPVAVAASSTQERPPNKERTLTKPCENGAS